MGLCKYCGLDLDGGDIYEVLKREYPEESEEILLEWAKNYGWTTETKKRFSKEIGHEHPDITDDGVAYYTCPRCNKIIRKGTYWDQYKAHILKRAEEVKDP